MCFGRNYTVINEIEYQYPFDTLLSIYFSSGDEELKYCVMMLILRLYIDRDPQTIYFIPQLTRNWHVIKDMGGT